MKYLHSSIEIVLDGNGSLFFVLFFGVIYIVYKIKNMEDLSIHRPMDSKQYARTN